MAAHDADEANKRKRTADNHENKDAEAPTPNGSPEAMVATKARPTITSLTLPKEEDIRNIMDVRSGFPHSSFSEVPLEERAVGAHTKVKPWKQRSARVFQTRTTNLCTAG